MTAIERLCDLLDEHGVEHEGGERSLRWRDRYGVMMQAFPLADGELGMEVWSCTPEQAIAATLGSCSCSNDCTNGERTNVPRLPHFWTHDGTLHIEATRMPTRIVVCEGGTCEFVPKRELDASEAENAKLRGFWTHDGTWHVELPKLPEGIAVTTPDERDREVRTAMVWRYVREDEAENDRLRELAERAWKTAERLCQAFDGPCRADDVTAYKPCLMGERDEECVYGQLQQELRELGVEVDDG